MSETYTDLYNKALNLVKTGAFIQAREILLELFKSNSENPELLHLLGVVENQLNNLDQAESFFLSSIKFSPKPQAMCYSNLAETFRKKGNAEKAIEALKKAIEINPNFHVAKYNLANIFKALGDFNQAIELYNQAIKLEPNNYQYYYNLANIFLSIGGYDLAIKYYQDAIKINPNLYQAYYHIGYSYENKNDLNSAIINYQKLIEVDPNYPETYKQLGICYGNFGKIEKSKEYYKKYLSFAKNDIGIDMHLDFMSENIYFSKEEINYYRNKLIKNTIKYTNKISIDNLNSTMPNIPAFIYQGRNNKKIKEIYANMFDKSLIRFNPQYEKKNKIRLGFFVSHGKENLFFILMKAFINNFSKDDFEVFIITNTLSSKSKLKSFIKNDYIKYTETPTNFSDLLEIVKKTSFDIIYYWEVGSSFVNYFLPIFKPAPIQCTSLGLPETSGLKEVNYFISHKLMEKTDSQDYYTEKLIKMDNLPLFYDKVSISKHYQKEHFGIDSKYNIYSCLQNLRKIHPDFEILVKGILEKDKNAIIVFIENDYESISDALKYRFRANLPTLYERIKFLPKLSYQEYLNFINYTDVILDTLYSGGGNTSIEGLSIGTPIITLPWYLQRGRFTYALYQMLEIEDCIATSMENYIYLAVKIACDKNLRNEIAKKIKARNNILFNNTKAVREMESVFKKMLSEIQIN